MSGIPPMTDGKLRLILLWMGPAPLSILGFEFGGFRFSSSRRSGLGIPLEGNLDRGGHSFSDLVGVFSGYFIGEMIFLGFLGPLSSSFEVLGFIAHGCTTLPDVFWVFCWFLGVEISLDDCPSDCLSSLSASGSVESDVSLSLFLDMDDFSLFMTHFLISSLDTPVPSSHGILFVGEAEPDLLMKVLRSSFLPSLSLEYLRSVGPDFRRQVSRKSVVLNRSPGRPFLSSLRLRSSDHASALLLYESTSIAYSNSLAMHSW